MYNCVRKRGFHCALSFRVFSSSSFSILLSFTLLYLPGSLHIFSFSSLQFLNLLPFPYLSLTSLSSTLLHLYTYEVQLRIILRKITFILLDSLKTYIIIYLFICLTCVSRCTKTCIRFLIVTISFYCERCNF